MSTETQTLTAWLLDQIAADEAAAQAALDAPGSEWWVDPRKQRVVRGSPSTRVPIAEALGWQTAAHIATHDPARVLAQCEALRAVVAVVDGWKHEVVEDCWYTCAAATEERDGGETCDDARRGTGCDCGRDFRANTVLRALAQVYRDHEAFDPSWSA